MKNALIYTVIFAAIQVVVSFGVQGAYTLIYGPGAKIDAMGLIITMAVFSVAVIALFLLTKWAEVSRHWVRTRPWAVLFWCVLAALGAIIPSTWLQEQMPELPNMMEDEFGMIMKERLGYFVVGLLAPRHCHLSSTICDYPRESCPDATCFLSRAVVGLDVLSYG